MKNEVIALDVLQKALMKHSEQTDDINVSPERAAGEHLTTGWFADGFAATLQTMSQAFSSGSKKIANSMLGESTNYDSTWVPPEPKPVPSNHDLWGTVWSTTKNAAIANSGLVRENTGLLSLLGGCSEKLGDAKTALESLTTESSAQDKSSAATKYENAQDALAATQKRILAIQPKARERQGEGENQTAKVVTHEPMLRYLNAFSSVLRRTANQLEQRYLASEIVDCEWAATPLQVDNWVDHWRVNWTSAVESCRIRGEGQTVSDKLHDYEEALKRITPDATFGVNQKIYVQAGNHLDQALKIPKTLWKCAHGFPNLETYISSTLGRTIQARRELETLLNRPLPDGYPSGGDFSVQHWEARCSWVKTNDLITNDGEAVKTALELVVNAETPADLQARSVQIKKLVDLTDALEEFSNSESGTHPKFLQYVNRINAEANNRAKELLQKQTNVQFSTPESVNLDKSQWKTTWANALEARIVPLKSAEEKLVRKKLTMWRDKPKTPSNEMTNAEQIAFHRGFAPLLNDLETAIDALEQKIKCSGFGNHDLYAWLGKVKAETNRQKVAEENFESTLITQAVDSIRTTWQMTRTRWQEFKREAILAGFYRENDRPKGLGSAIDAVANADAAMQSSTSQPLSLRKTAALKTLDALKKFDAIIDQHISRCGESEPKAKQFFVDGKENALQIKGRAQETITQALGSEARLPAPEFSAEHWGAMTQRATDNALIGSEHLSAFKAVKKGIKKCPSTDGPFTFETRKNAIEHYQSLENILPPIKQLLDATNQNDFTAWSTFLPKEVRSRKKRLVDEETNGPLNGTVTLTLTQAGWTALWTSATAYLPKTHDADPEIKKYLKAFEAAQTPYQNDTGTTKQRLTNANAVLSAVNGIINSVKTLQSDGTIRNENFKNELGNLINRAETQKDTVKKKITTITKEAEEVLTTNFTQFTQSLSDKSWDTAWGTLKTAAQQAGLYETTGVKLRAKLKTLRAAKTNFETKKQDHEQWDPNNRGIYERFTNYDPKKLLIEAARQYINACIATEAAAKTAKNAPTTVGDELKNFFENVISQVSDLKEEASAVLRTFSVETAEAVEQAPTQAQ